VLALVRRVAAPDLGQGVQVRQRGGVERDAAERRVERLRARRRQALERDAVAGPSSTTRRSPCARPRSRA